MELIGETVLDELDAERLITIRTGLGGPEVSSAHPLHGEVLRTDIPPLRMRQLRLALARKLESLHRPTPHGSRPSLALAPRERPDRRPRASPRCGAGSARPEPQHGRTPRTAGLRHQRLPFQATLLLAEILTHTGRVTEAAALTDALPPDSLDTADREALVYCAAVGQGLLAGDPGGGADIVAGVLAGDSAASDRLRALYSSLLAFDARFDEALEAGSTLVDDPEADPVTRTFAAIGTVGAEYWLGRTRRAVAVSERAAPVAEKVRGALPFGAASIELMAICALLDQGDLDQAAARTHRMRQQAAVDHDPFTGPRAEYCAGRIALLRGRPATALLDFRRCLAAVGPFDHSLAAMLAADLRMPDAADHAAWAAGIAADRSEWNMALAGYHDAARYGAARRIIIPMRDAIVHVDGTLAWCLLDHASALATRDPVGIDEVGRRFESHGAMLFAAESSAEAALAHSVAGRPRQARASANRAAALQSSCEGATSPWLLGADVGVALTRREQQVARLAAEGLPDNDIAARLGISARTVQTHLARVYTKLGITRRTQIADRMRPFPVG